MLQVRAEVIEDVCVCVLQVRAEVVEDLYTARKKQHQTMMHYFSSLNTLQYKKKISLLEPLLGYMQAQVLYMLHYIHIYRIYTVYNTMLYVVYM